MKKLLSILLFITSILIISTSVFAANGDIIGHIYSTDIRAYINGVEVQSYNIGGKTAVVIEDILEENSTAYVYDDYSRTLKFFSLSPNYLVEGKSESKTTSGRIVGKIYETDIKTSIYDVVIPTYNIGGKTAVTIEDLGYDNAFSPIGGKFIWNETERTIELEFLYSKWSDISRDKDITVSFDEAMTEATATFEEKFHCGGSQEHFDFPDYVTDNSDIEVVVPIKAQGETIGYYFRRPSKDYKFTAFTYYYPEKVKEAEKTYTPAPYKTREEIIGHFLGVHSVGEPVERFDTENYSFVYISVAGTSWTSYNLLQAYDDGTYIDYGEIIYTQNRSPHNLIIDKKNEKVTFKYVDRYHSEWFTNYEIDLKSGEIKTVEGADDLSSVQEPTTENVTEQSYEELNYKIHLTDRKEQTKDCEGKFSVKYTPDNIATSGDAEYFSSSIHSNGNEYEILLQFFDGNYAGKLIDMFRAVSSGSQALPIHNEEEKYDLVNEKIKVMINGKTAEKVAVKTVSWKGETTVYIYPRDLQPCNLGEIKEINICVE